MQPVAKGVLVLGFRSYFMSEFWLVLHYGSAYGFMKSAVNCAIVIDENIINCNG